MMHQGRDSEPTLSLFDFTARVGCAVHSHPDLRNVWITAELSDVAVRGGHFYADLVEKDREGRTVARMRANLWASLFPQLRARFMAERQDDFRNGLKLRLRGSATHHNLYGLSFNITDVDPSYVDEGDILRRRMEILQKMKEEGVYDANRSQPLPADCQRVAVISAEGAAGLGDFLNQLEHNPDGFRFKVRLFPSPMQGEKVTPGIISCLKAIYEDRASWDCVAIIRGGGATADMNCFDNEQLARNICYFPLPVIVGIGHERDNCVLDYLAHTRCKTPTAVAEFLIAHQRQAWQSVGDRVNEIIRYVSLYLDGEKQRVSQFEAAVPALVGQHMEREKMRMRNFTAALPMATGGLTSRELTRLEGMAAQLPVALDSALRSASQKLSAMESLVGALSPENTLRRGYSVTRIDGRAVRSASELSPGAVIQTVLASGEVASVVESVSSP